MANAYICKSAIWQIAIPFVLNLSDLASRFVVENVDFAVDNLFLANHLDNITGFQVHADGVAAIGDFVAKPLNLLEGCL